MLRFIKAICFGIVKKSFKLPFLKVVAENYWSEGLRLYIRRFGHLLKDME